MHQANISGGTVMNIYKTQLTRWTYYLLMAIVGVLAINQIVRFSHVEDGRNAIIYRYCLVALFLLMTLYIVAQRRYALNLRSTYIILFIVFISIVDVVHGESIAAAIASIMWLLSLICGWMFEKEEVYEAKPIFHILLWLAIMYFVVNDVLANYTKIIQARSDVISANNVIYFGFPLLLLFKGKKISLLEVLITAIMIAVAAFSFKRTTLVVAVLSVSLYYIARLSMSGTPVRRILLIPLFVLLISFGVIAIDNYTGGHISYRFSVISATGGNGRTDIWMNVLEKMKGSSFSTLLFGHGFNSVKDSFGISAHNDFLECYYDFGLIGIIMYLGIVIYIGKSLLIAKTKKIYEYPVFLGFYSGFIVLSAFSHVFLYAFVSIPLYFFLGYLCKRAGNKVDL